MTRWGYEVWLPFLCPAEVLLNFGGLFLCVVITTALLCFQFGDTVCRAAIECSLVSFVTGELCVYGEKQ